MSDPLWLKAILLIRYNHRPIKSLGYTPTSMLVFISEPIRDMSAVSDQTSAIIYWDMNYCAMHTYWLYNWLYRRWWMYLCVRWRMTLGYSSMRIASSRIVGCGWMISLSTLMLTSHLALEHVHALVCIDMAGSITRNISLHRTYMSVKAS